MDGAAVKPGGRRLRIPRVLIRFAVTTFQHMRRAIWFFSRPQASGVHAIPVTPEGRIVLVRLTYAKGWRMPGGGRGRSEDPVEAVLRELREEIGLVSHGEVELLGEVEDKPDFRSDRSHHFLVRDVAYRPRQTLEVEEVAEFDPGRLPPGMAAGTLRRIAALDLASHD
jgi:8-oxo-dGTP pyrophosphatase MutT (NUDIX family)